MALNPEQQAVELISRARQILITTREHASVDSIGSVIATSLLLRKLGKSHDLVIPDFKPEQLPGFFTKDVKIQDKLGAIRSLRLSLDVTRSPLSELMYDVKDGKLEITVVPKHGEWTPQDVSFRHGDDRYDLVIAVDTPDMASLGAAFREKADFFYRTTTINIDANPANEYWGQVNIVDLNAVSTTEVLYNFINRWNSQMITPEMATALLAGMIAKTRSFRTPNVTPRTLDASSKLIDLGARREEIVASLWRTRTVPILKLWGRALARLEQDRELGLVWTTLAESDYLASGARPEDLEGVVDELLAFAPEAKIIVIMQQENAHALRIHLHASPPLSATDIARPFGASGTREHVSFTFNAGQTVTENAQKFLEKLKSSLRA